MDSNNPRSYSPQLHSSSFTSYAASSSSLAACVVPVDWPIIGMLPSFVAHTRQAHHRITAVLQVTGGNFLFKGPWFTNMDYFATADPANVSHILGTNFPNYSKGEDFTEMFDILGDGILNSDGETWLSQRKTVLPLLSSRRFRIAVTEQA